MCPYSIDSQQPRCSWMSNFNTESLIRAMHLPVDEVILNFKKERRENDWHTESAQAELASTIYRVLEPRANSIYSDQIQFEPAARYIRKLLHSYARFIEESESKQMENDDLVELMVKYQYRSNGYGQKLGSTTLDENVPNPRDSCYVSFVIPNESFNSDCDGDAFTNNDSIVGIKIYPHHNDVGVQKVWEAGAALTEFLIANVHYVKNKKICELGAGVGLTGLVIAGICNTRQVHMTDYTKATLENLEHNCTINIDWIKLTRRENASKPKETDQMIVTAGYLEWDEFQSKDISQIGKAEEEPDCERQSEKEGKSGQFLQSPKQSLISAMNADVLMAADVVYDRSVIPQLIKVVRNILVSSSADKEKIAIFATTYRNADTFALFLRELQMCSDEIECNFIENDVLESMPYIFPCYYKQPRSHVRICIISVKQ